MRQSVAKQLFINRKTDEDENGQSIFANPVESDKCGKIIRNKVRPFIDRSNTEAFTRHVLYMAGSEVVKLGDLVGETQNEKYEVVADFGNGKYGLI